MRFASFVAFAGLMTSAVLVAGCDGKKLGEEKTDSAAPPTSYDPRCWTVDQAITDLEILEQNLGWGARSIGTLDKACADTSTREARRKLEKHLRDHDLRMGPELPGLSGFVNAAENTVTRILASATAACERGAQASARIASAAATAADFRAAHHSLSRASAFLAASCGRGSTEVLSAPANTQTASTDTHLKPEEAPAPAAAGAAPDAHLARPRQ